MSTSLPPDSPSAGDTVWCRGALLQVEQYRRDLLAQPQALREAADYQAESTGKRLRPTVLLCFALVGQARPRATPGVLRAAAAVELLHEASLIHDDILDHSSVRRGRPSVPEKFGVSTASHLGAFMVMAAVSALAEACVAEGAALDLGLLRALCQAQLEEGLSPLRDPAAQRQRCVRVIQGKTGALFKLAAQVGAGFANPAGCHAPARRAAEPFAECLALAFQLRDDLADLENAEHLRKPGGSDLLRGLPTLPFQMWASSQPSPEAAWDRLVNCRNAPIAAEQLRQDVVQSGVLREVRELILAQLNEARGVLGALPASPALNTLGALLDQIAPASGPPGRPNKTP
ncbi:MAG TPA: polyprenyl synthetase family protein [Gemmata sp.]